ncbi:MAG: aminoglycoside phosphotransferase family protein [Firmicutes bacterium]|nr:aminoglycoside phosphotransferase family protein [Bacillota bacterium]
MNREVIGKGKTAKVYLDNGIAYKVFRDAHPMNWIEYEVQIQNEIFEHTSLPVLPYKLNPLKREIEMPYVQGIELTKRIRNEKYKEGLEDFIRLQLDIYSYKNLNLPNAHQVFIQHFENHKISSDYKSIGLKYLSEIPFQPVLCHFDLHFSNILYDGNYTIIDWVNAKLANPILDVARSFVILRQYAFRLSSKYLKIMMRKMQFSEVEMKKAIVVMAILRIIEIEQSEIHVLHKIIEEFHIS